jgi:hypothetical protein
LGYTTNNNYGFETWSLILREENHLPIFDDKVLKKIFEAKKYEVSGQFRKLHKEKWRSIFSGVKYRQGIEMGRQQ